MIAPRSRRHGPENLFMVFIWDSRKCHKWRHKNMSKKKGWEEKLERRSLKKRWIIDVLLFHIRHFSLSHFNIEYSLQYDTTKYPIFSVRNKTGSNSAENNRTRSLMDMYTYSFIAMEKVSKFKFTECHHHGFQQGPGEGVECILNKDDNI